MLLLMACQLPSVYAWVALRLQSTRRKLQLGVLYPQYQQCLCTNSICNLSPSPSVLPLTAGKWARRDDGADPLANVAVFAVKQH